jgi:hypothetical protein
LESNPVDMAKPMIPPADDPIMLFTGIFDPSNLSYFNASAAPT